MTATDRESARAERLGRNQTLYREVNERVKEINHAFDSLVPLGDWICECGNDRCSQRIELTSEEYEAVRAEATHFAVAPDDAHVFPEVERVVERHDRYWVVEKVGVAAAVAAGAAGAAGAAEA
ncbi:MAG: hypothetical protein M3321_06695 [Actinomycetota bacterium]|nr:hypothetical protein [Actinomycetota bacterium]